jgi:hypothetical protein
MKSYSPSFASQKLTTIKHLDDSTRTADPTGDQGVAVLVDYNPTFNYAGNVGALIGPMSTARAGPAALVEVAGTSIYNFDMITYGLPPIAFQNKHTIKNNAGVARKLTPSWSFISAPGYVADGATVQLRGNDVGYQQSDFWAQPLWHTINSGVIDGDTLATAAGKRQITAGFTSQFFAQGNVTLGTYIGFQVLMPKVTDRVAGWDAVDGIIKNTVGLEVPRMTQGTVTNLGMRCNTKLALWDDTVTFTAAPGPVIEHAGVFTMNYASAVAPAIIKYVPYIAYSNDGGTQIAVQQIPQFINDGATAGIDFGNQFGYTAQPTISAFIKTDVTNTQYVGFYAAPSYSSISSGVLVAASDYGLYLAPTVGASTTLTNRIGIHIADVANSGTVTNNTGLNIVRFTAGSTTKVGIRCDSQVKLAADTLTVTADPGAGWVLSVPGAYTVNYASSTLNTLIEVSPTIDFTQDNTALGGLSGYRYAPTIGNVAASSGVDLKIFTDFVASPTFIARGTNVTDTTLGTHIGFSYGVTFSRASAGDQLACTSDTAFQAGMTVGAGQTVTTRYGFRVVDATNSGTLTTQVGVEIPSLTGGTTNIGLRNASRTVYPPSTQNLTAVSDTITPTATVHEVTLNAAYTLTSTPHIADGQSGQMLVLINADSADALTLRDQSAIASNLRLPGAANLVLGSRDTATFIFSSALGDWICVGTTNN